MLLLLRHFTLRLDGCLTHCPQEMITPLAYTFDSKQSHERLPVLQSHWRQSAGVSLLVTELKIPALGFSWLTMEGILFCIFIFPFLKIAIIYFLRAVWFFKSYLGPVPLLCLCITASYRSKSSLVKYPRTPGSQTYGWCLTSAQQWLNLNFVYILIFFSGEWIN